MGKLRTDIASTDMDRDLVIRTVNNGWEIEIGSDGWEIEIDSVSGRRGPIFVATDPQDLAILIESWAGTQGRHHASRS